MNNQQPVERDTSIPDPELASRFLGAVQQWWLSEMVREDAEKAATRRYDVLQLIKDNPRISMRELADKCGISLSVVVHHLNQLQKEGLIYREHGRARSIYVVEKQTEAGHGV